MHTGTLLAALADRDARYAGWTASNLADQVRPFGLSSRQTPLQGVNRNGYRLTDIDAAIAGHSGR